MTIDNEGEPFDAGLTECESDPPPPVGVELRQYDFFCERCVRAAVTGTNWN